MVLKQAYKIKNFKKQLCILTALFLTLSIFFIQTTSAAALTALSDTMSRLKVSTASDHTIKYTTPSGVAAGGTMTITMPAGFTIGSVDNTDIDVSWGASTGYENELTLGATASGATWGAAFSGQVLTITSGTGTITASSKVVIEIGNNASGGNAQITNNSTAATYTISIAGTFGDTGNIAVIVISDDQIPVTATVNPSLSFTVANTTLALGVLDSGSISTTGYNNVTIGTNGTNGYTISVKDAGNSSSPGLYNSAASKLIASSTATLSAGAEGYGGNCNKVSGDGSCSFVDGATQNVTGFTLAGSSFASHSAKPTGTETFQIRVKAAIASTTNAGSYSDTLTLIATGNF